MRIDGALLASNHRALQVPMDRYELGFQFYRKSLHTEMKPLWESN